MGTMCLVIFIGFNCAVLYYPVYLNLAPGNSEIWISLAHKSLESGNPITPDNQTNRIWNDILLALMPKNNLCWKLIGALVGCGSGMAFQPTAT